MCPDRKLDWFKDHQISATEISKIRAMVVSWWKSRWASNETENADPNIESDKKRVIFHYS